MLNPPTKGKRSLGIDVIGNVKQYQKPNNQWILGKVNECNLA
jgi:hypothetical protein